MQRSTAIGTFMTPTATYGCPVCQSGRMRRSMQNARPPLSKHQHLKPRHTSGLRGQCYCHTEVMSKDYGSCRRRSAWKTIFAFLTIDIGPGQLRTRLWFQDAYMLHNLLCGRIDLKWKTAARNRTNLTNSCVYANTNSKVQNNCKYLVFTGEKKGSETTWPRTFLAHHGCWLKRSSAKKVVSPIMLRR